MAKVSLKDRLTYRLRQGYQEDWNYDESAQIARRNEMSLKPVPVLGYLPSAEKARRTYYRLKHTTNPQLRHLYESYLMYGKQLFKWTTDSQLEDGLNTLMKNPENAAGFDKISSTKKVELMNIIDQFVNKQEAIMSTAVEMPLEYGEEMPMNDMASKVNEDIYEKFLFADLDQDEAAPSIPKAASKDKDEEKKEQEPVPEKKEEEAPKKNLKDYTLPERKPEVPKNFNWFKTIIEKHFPPKKDNIETIFRILMIIISKSSDTSVQEDFIGLTGYSQLDMLQELLIHRSDIRGFMRDALKSINYDKANPRFDDILVVLQMLGINMDNMQPKRANYFDIMKEESMATTTVYGSNAERVEDKVCQVQRYKAAAKDEHKDIKRIPLTAFPDWAQPSFKDMKELNPIQSSVFESAFHSNKNMLICAPTGAGKTNIALMTVLRELESQGPETGFARKRFTMIYVTPMKALAAEIVSKFSDMLGYMRVRVRELTGDMQLTRTEMEETHILVVTPEKLDVVTRKSDSLLLQTKLVIFDEIHLLDEDRGAVLECLVIRILNHIQRRQVPLRIVGLSATLPNYMDVANFLKAESGTFFFDGSFRPTPLAYEFYGIKAQGNQMREKNIANFYCYNKVKEVLKKGKQVLVFVHSRAETVNLGNELIEFLQQDKAAEKALFLDNDERSNYRSEVGRSSHRGLQQLYDFSIGIHNAGMLRKDRNLSEKLFMKGATKVLISTATLAWGVNLPAFCVIIKGTEFYDPSQGKYVDVGILDIQQIFGRAGRPQYDSEGEAVIITSQAKMQYFIGMLTNQTAIESTILNSLNDAINAEVANGSITSIEEGITWLKYSFLEQRLNKNPHKYGCKPEEVSNDPGHQQLFEFFMKTAVINLKKEGMVSYNAESHSILPTEIGRTAANYYIKHETAALYLKKLDEYIDSQGVLKLLASANEFENIKTRKDEIEELKRIQQTAKLVSVEANEELMTDAKVLLLIEAYLYQQQLGAFSLIADTNYIMQNVVRLSRGMFEIAIRKKLPRTARQCMQWSIRLEKRMLEDHSFARQFAYSANVNPMNFHRTHQSMGFLKEEVLRIMESAPDQFTVQSIFDDDRIFVAKKLGARVYYDNLMQYLQHFPLVRIHVEAQPITRTILKINLTITAKFVWSDRWNHSAENYWIIVDDTDVVQYCQQFSILKKEYVRSKHKEFEVSFYIPFPRIRNEASVYHFSVISENWLDAEDSAIIDLRDIELPPEDYAHTKLENRPLLPLSALNEPKYEKLYAGSFAKFNKVQTQVFDKLYKSDDNVLVGAPTGSGKTVIGELAMLRSFSTRPSEKVVYIAPLKALTKERLNDWSRRLPEFLGRKVVELTGDYTPDMRSLQAADLVITTPEKWDGITRHWEHREYAQKVSLVLIDEIHLLGQERGPVLEVIVARMRNIGEKLKKKIRFVGLSTALANARDVAGWLGVKESGLFNFAHSERPVPLTVHVDGFSEKAYCPRMASMNKPAYAFIHQYSHDHPVLIFVSSRRQTRLTALDMISFSTEQFMTKKPFLHESEEFIQAVVGAVNDEHLQHTLMYGIGMHHAGLSENVGFLHHHITF